MPKPAKALEANGRLPHGSDAAKRKVVAVVFGSGEQIGLPSVPAEFLYYRSPLFAMSLHWAKLNADEWRVLSAANGLIRPSDNIAPYTLKLADLSLAQRKDWAQAVIQQAVTEFPDAKFILLAPKDVCELLDDLPNAERPFTNMRVADMCSWLAKGIEKWVEDPKEGSFVTQGHDHAAAP